MSRILREPPLPTDEQTSPGSSSDRWWPYSSSGDFGSSLSMVLVALICSLACGLAIHAVARFVVRWWKAAHDPSESTKPAASATAAIPASPALVYSSGMELAGATAECAICLTEFADGERVRVLPRCRHGFHVACVEAWLASHDSCPTCRGLCLAEKSPDKAPPLPAAAV
ncbi:RING-H2 finger protein [Nymphaea thermarum]|nr:RING-H2 finger protein [Nymphaea thermarum]